jgi:hypothetical protein
MSGTTISICPACGGDQLVETRRGYAGQSDTPHQYVTCQDCGQVTYEILSVTQREIRLYRYEQNGILAREGATYQIRRLLKVGFDEYLLYLRLIEIEKPAAVAELPSEIAAGSTEPAEPAEPVEIGEGEPN